MEEFPPEDSLGESSGYEPLVEPINIQIPNTPSPPPMMSLLRGITDQQRSAGYVYYHPKDTVSEESEEMRHVPTGPALVRGGGSPFQVSPVEDQESMMDEPMTGLGYDLDDFTATGYVGAETLSGYLNFDLQDDLIKEDDPGSGGESSSSSSVMPPLWQERRDRMDMEEPILINIVPSRNNGIGVDYEDDDEEDGYEANYVDHPVSRTTARQESTTDLDASLETQDGSPRRVNRNRKNAERAVVVADSRVFQQSSLEMEDLFSEVVRKTGAIYGRQKLMEFLQRTAEYFGEQSLLAAISKSVRITSPTLLNDTGHLSRTVWNEKFQAALEISNSTERNERLAALRADFISTAEFYGRIILAERWLPVYRKSIKPISLGGVAGGTKYLVQGVLYKFAEDVDLGQGRWMYGGETRNDAAAAKACGNELKGLSAVFQASSELDIRVPLMCLVDFSGFRISAQAFLPVGSDTLVYGSRDGGKTIFSGKGMPKVVAVMSRLAERLRLEPHFVLDARSEKHLLYTPTDIEVHLGSDGRYYLIDSARLMPPQRPSSGMVRAVFYQLFRSEFLTWYNVPLSPDGYTRFGLHNWRQHNARLRAASEILTDTRIPEFARQLSSVDAEMLTSLMHSWGINIRFLGYVRHRSADKEVRAAALLEMIARTLQKSLQERLRDEMSRLRAPQMSPYLHLISDFFNTLSSDAWFWKRPELLKSRLIEKFGLVSLTEEERSSRVSLATLINMSTLISRLCHLAGIHLRSGPRDDLNELFVTSDFAMVPRITEMDIASLALAEQYRKQAKRKLGSNKLHLLQSSAEIFSKAAISHPHHLANRVRWLRVLIAILRHSVRTKRSDLEAEFSRAEAVLNECLEETNSLNTSVPEVLFLHSSLLRQKYHHLVNSSGSSAPLLGLEFWCTSYKLLLLSHDLPVSSSLHVGLNTSNEARLEHRKANRWFELVMGLASLTDLRDISHMASLLGPIVAQDLELARYMLAIIGGRKSFLRLFGVLFTIFRPFPNLMELLKRWINQRSKLTLRHLTMEYLEDSVVANYLQLCNQSVVELDLSYCSGITNDALLMLARMPLLKSLSLRHCNRISDEGVLSVLASFGTSLCELDLSFCTRLTDDCLVKLKLPNLQRLILRSCVSLEGEFLRGRGFAPKLVELRVDSCHRLTKKSLLRISNDSYPNLETLNLAQLGVASGQVVASLLKNCASLQSLNLRNTHASEKGFRTSGRLEVNLTHLCLSESDLDDNGLSLVALFPKLTRLSLKQCALVTSNGILAFVKARPEGASPLTHLNMTDMFAISELAMNAILCELPASPQSWVGLKLRGVGLAVMTVQSVLSSASGLEVLSLSGRPESDLGGTQILVHSLRKLHLEISSWSMKTIRPMLSSAMVSIKLRSCPNINNSALQVISTLCESLRKLSLVTLPLSGAEGIGCLVNFKMLRHLTLYDLALTDSDVAPVIPIVVPLLSSLTLRELALTDTSWQSITRNGAGLKQFRMSRCPIQNSPNRLMLLPKLEELHLMAFSTLPFEHGEMAAELNQLRIMTLDAAICANASAFERLGYCRSIQSLIVLPLVPAAWWQGLAEKPIRYSLQSLFINVAPQAAIPFLRGMSALIEINLRESVARSVYPDIGAMFPVLRFPPRSVVMQKSRTSSSVSLSSRSRQQSLVRAILNTSSSVTDLSEEETSDPSLPDVSQGWALLSEAHSELQLNVAGLLLESGYRLILVYRSNRTGAAEVAEFANRYPDRVTALKIQEFFEGKAAALEKLKVDRIELVISGLSGQSGEERAGCSIDYLRRSMQEIPYALVNLIELVKPLTA